MTDIVKGMALEHCLSSDKDTYDLEAMRAALLWLANNVSDEMCAAARNVHPCTYETMIAAAIRAAAGEEQ